MLCVWNDSRGYESLLIPMCMPWLMCVWHTFDTNYSQDSGILNMQLSTISRDCFSFAVDIVDSMVIDDEHP